MFSPARRTSHEEFLLLSKAVDSAQNGIVITDPRLPDNPIIYSNPAFTKMTGFTREEILGKNCRFLQGSETSQAGVESIRAALRSEMAVTTVLRNHRSDGTLFYNELTISPVRDENSELIAYIGVQNDITPRIEAEKRISEFYSVVSHELRTPIAKIISSLAVLHDGDAGPLSKPVRRFVQISTDAANSLWRLVENILDFRKLELGKFRLCVRKLNLAELIEHAVTDFKPIADSAEIGLNYSCKKSAFVDADGERIVQVLDNLLNNAVKFAPKQSKVLVEVLQDEKNWIKVIVRDTGRGISPEDMPKLFKRFQQLEAADIRTRNGSGLGLVICKEIIESHGGKIGVESEFGSWCLFWFSLPIAVEKKASPTETLSVF